MCYNGQAAMSARSMQDFAYQQAEGLRNLGMGNFTLGLPPWILVTALDIYKMDPKKIVASYLKN